MHPEVDSHTHTVASGHAYSTLSENVSAAAARGIKLLAITDHGPAMPGAPHFWFFMNMRVIQRIMDGVGILRGVEANIMSQKGELDIPPEVLQNMDIVLGSLHEPLFPPQNKIIHTDTVIKTMASGKIDVFAHGGNPSFPLDYEAVAQAAAEYKVLIEINNSSFTTSRQGSDKNCAQLAHAVAENGGMLTFGTDAHIANLVGDFTECEKLVRSVDFPVERILSYRGREFLEFLRKKNRQVNLTELYTLFDDCSPPPTI